MLVIYFRLAIVHTILGLKEGFMSFWQNLLRSDQQKNELRNQVACVESDCACTSNEQLIASLLQEQDPEIRQGKTKVLMSRGYTRKELDALIEANSSTRVN